MSRRSNGKASHSGGDSAAIPPIDPQRKTTHSTLSRLDWIAVGLVALALLLAAVWAGALAGPVRPDQPGSAAIGDTGLLGPLLDVWTAPGVVILTAIACFVVVLREWKRPVSLAGVPGLAPSMALVGIWAIVSAARSPAVYLSLNGLAYLFAALLIGGLVYRLSRDPNAIAAFALTIVMVSSLIAGIGVNQYSYHLRLHDVNYRTFATFTDPNFAAGYLLLTLPITLSVFVAMKERSLRLLVGLGLALQSACIFLTASRAGAGIAIVTVLLWAALAIVMRGSASLKWIAASLILFITIAGVSSPSILSRISSPQAAQSSGGKSTDTPTPAPPVDAQAHSADFRKWTWVGTVQMALKNPVLGAGIGTFDITFPRYAVTAHTVHAHNGLLQWMGETGIPGILFLLTGFAAAAAFVLHAILHRRQARRAGQATKAQDGAWLNDPGVLLAGSVAGVIGMSLHNLFDSDLYVIATALTFGALCGLMTSQARGLMPQDAPLARPLTRETLSVVLVICLLMLVRGAQIGLSRWQLHLATHGPVDSESLQAARAAAAFDPMDPEPHLLLARLQFREPAAEEEYKTAARLSSGGMTYYLLARYYQNTGRMPQALAAFEQARNRAPRNPQILRALAECQAQMGSVEPAKETYNSVAALEKSVFGKVRAMPEMVETDFAYAHVGLADIAFDQRKLEDALQEYTLAAGVLKEYWIGRNWTVNTLNRPEEKRRALADLYIHVLRQRGTILSRLNRQSEAEQAGRELDAVEADIQADAARSDKSAGG